jgi:hypothetical protein
LRGTHTLFTGKNRVYIRYYGQSAFSVVKYCKSLRYLFPRSLDQQPSFFLKVLSRCKGRHRCINICRGCVHVRLLHGDQVQNTILH